MKAVPHLKLWPHSDMQCASSTHTSGNGRRGFKAIRSCEVPTRSGETKIMRSFPS
jgi:hypothetical protein